MTLSLLPTTVVAAAAAAAAAAAFDDNDAATPDADSTTGVGSYMELEYILPSGCAFYRTLRL